MKTTGKFKALAFVMSLLICISAIPLPTLSAINEVSMTNIGDDNYSISSADVLQANKNAINTDAQIIGEIESKRTINEKYFRLSDGSELVAEYPYPVHELNEKNMWENIDNSLALKGVELSTADNSVKLSTASGQVTTKQLLSGSANKLITFNSNNNPISWSYEGQKNTKAETATKSKKLNIKKTREDWLNLENIFSSVKYTEIYNNVDLEIIIGPNMVKDNIILKKPNTQNSFTVYYNIGKLIASSLDEKTVVLSDADKKEQYIISAPMMYDANGEFSYSLSLNILSQKDGVLTLNLTADKNWIESNERAFPVVIDPVITTTQSSANIQTRYYTTAYTSYAHGTLYVGYQKGGMGVASSAVKFTLPNLDKDDLIINASLNLYQTKHSSAEKDGINIIDAYEITAQWNSSTSVPGIVGNPPAYNARVLDYSRVSFETDKSFISWDITSTAQKWYNNTLENNGILLKAHDETNWTLSNFMSPQGVSYSSGAMPIIVLQYVNINGLNPYHEYTNIGSAYKSSCYVNNFSGNLTYSYGTALNNGNLTAYSIGHYYNSSDYLLNDAACSHEATANKAYYGKGFRTSMNEHIKQQTINSETYYVHTNAEGNVSYFRPIKENNVVVRWEDEVNPKNVITKANGAVIITYENGAKRTFHQISGRPHQIIDSDGNTLQYNYDNTAFFAPRSITDSLGRTMYFNYDSNHYLSSVTDAYNRTTYYTYQNGYLKTITDADGKVTEFNYDSKGRLCTVINPQNLRTDIAYNSASTMNPKVSSITEQGTDGEPGEQYHFTYTYGKTTITDRQGNSLTNTFDYLGRTINKIDDDGNIVSASYDSNHRVTDQDSEKYIDNHIPNGNLEELTNWGVSNWGTGTYSYSSGLNTTDKYCGKSSLKITVDKETDTSIGRLAFANRITAGKTYTASAYIKTQNVSSKGGAGLYVAIRNASGAVIYIRFSDFVTGTTDWQRVTLTFTVPNDANVYEVRLHCGITYSSGTMLVDNVQLEEGPVANRYNLLENGSLDRFSGDRPLYWSIHTQTPNCGYATISDRGARNGVGFIFASNHSQTNYILQKVDVNVQKGQIISFSGWAIGKSVDLSKEGRFFAINIAYNYVENGVQKRYSNAFNFNDEIELWQYMKHNIVALGNTTQIEFALLYHKNANYAIFDDLQLFVGDSGQQYKYDSKGNVTTVYDGSKKTTYQYDANNNITKITYPDSKTEDITYYSGIKRIHTIRDYYGTLYTYTYDSYGNVLKMDIGEGETVLNVTNTYTQGGNHIQSTTDANGKTTTYTYNSKDLLESVTDPNGNVTIYTYYPNNDRLHTVSSGGASASYTYDEYNLKTISCNGNVYDFSYDSFADSVMSVKIGNQSLIDHVYTANNGRAVSSTYGNGTVLENIYRSDSDNTVVGKKVDGVQTAAYELDSGGRIGSKLEIADNNKISYQYDDIGRPVSSSSSKAHLKEYYRYDSMNRLTHEDYYTNAPNERYSESIRHTLTHAVIGSDGRLSSSNFGYGTRYYTYDGAGRIKSSYYRDNGGNTLLSESYGFAARADGKSSMIVENYSMGNKNYSYTYDNNGNILTVSLDNVQCAKYTYDSLNQLIRSDDAAAGKTTVYTYDNGGNILSQREYEYTTGTLGEAVSENTYTYGDTEWKDKLTAFNGNVITYDGIGNPLNYYDGKNFTWTGGRRLESITEGENSYSYTYDSDGLRTTKTVNGETTEFVRTGSKLLEVRCANGDMIGIQYDSTGTAVGFDFFDYSEQTLVFYYYTYNLQGDITGITNRSGDILVEYAYDAWGNILSITGSCADSLGQINPLRYRGYYYDIETGLYYVSSRYYDPEVGRWINTDDAIAGVGGDIRGYSLFSYCFNNPVNMSDPTGNWPKLSQIFTAVAVAAVVVAAVATTVVTCGAAAPALAAVGGGIISAGAAATATTVATGALITAGVATTAAIVTGVVENTSYRGPTRNQSVYVMRDKTTGDVQYVGRTNNPIRRQSEHAKDPKKANLQLLEVKFSGLTKFEARAMEQALISAYSLENLINARREIATGNVGRFAGKIGNIISIFGGAVEDELLNLMGR